MNDKVSNAKPSSFRPKAARGNLDGFALDIEFLLISVIQGLALTTLATFATRVLENGNVTAWLYVVSALLLILLFFAQAINHALSFIDWPLNFWHTFLYFAIGFIEVLSFSQIENPHGWFFMIFIFSAVTLLLYLIDLEMIRERKPEFSVSSEAGLLYKDIESEQIKELYIIVPFSIVFNALAWFLIITYPEVFIDQGYHLALIGLQVLASIVVLFRGVVVFKRRSELIKRVYYPGS